MSIWSFFSLKEKKCLTNIDKSVVATMSRKKRKCENVAVAVVAGVDVDVVVGVVVVSCNKQSSQEIQYLRKKLLFTTEG